MIDAHAVLQAARRLDRLVLDTPLEPAPTLSERAGADVLLKLENRQRTGSFKLRGALNAIGALSDAERRRGLVTASAGNHGLGVAHAARALNVHATVFVPAGAPETKRRRIRRLGAELREIEGGYDDAHAEAERFAARAGAVYVHAFSEPAVVAGQGTVGLEILRVRPDIGTIVVPVGGGGLAGGIGVIARALGGARVVGVQSDATRTMYDSLAAGHPTSTRAATTICDGLAGDVDARSLALVRAVVDEVVLVEERRVRETVRALYEDEGVVAEGSGAVAAAAVQAGLVDSRGAPVAVVVSGGNVDANLLATLLTESA